ncbi:MAG: TSUP family transporter [Bacteroidia bacterium]
MSVSPANKLFPVFLKLENLHVLLVGGGAVALEKLNAILENSPLTKVTIVAKSINREIEEIVMLNQNLTLLRKPFDDKDLEGKDIIVTAVNDFDLSKYIRSRARSKHLLVNSADKPEACDFYLGSIVKKGDLKIAISTNGKSPTMAKRVKETLNEVFPDETQEVLENLYDIRETLKGDFSSKVKVLDELTKEYKLPAQKKSIKSKIISAGLYSILVIVSMLVGHLLLSYVPIETMSDFKRAFSDTVGPNFYYFVIGGFIAQMIDGALGMAYGVSVTTFLLSLGIPFITPAIASASMHAAEIFTTGSSSLIYMRHKNVNKKLFKKLLIPGICGAAIGAIVIANFSKEYVGLIKPIVSTYTLILGTIIILRALNVSIRKKEKVKHIFPVAFFGGLLDSVGGGGWGPIVTTSLVAGGRNLRYAIGSSHLAKFFVAIMSTLTFIIIFGLSHWQIILGLVIGGMIAAPLSIYFSTKIPTKKGLLLVGVVVILISLKSIINSINNLI